MHHPHSHSSHSYGIQAEVVKCTGARWVLHKRCIGKALSAKRIGAHDEHTLGAEGVIEAVGREAIGKGSRPELVRQRGGARPKPASQMGWWSENTEHPMANPTTCFPENERVAESRSPPPLIPPPEMRKYGGQEAGAEEQFAGMRR